MKDAVDPGLLGHQLLAPWEPIEGSGQGFVIELQLEVSQGHPLHGQQARPLARRIDQDDVLFQLIDGRVAEVHLTWSSAPEPAPTWPSTRFFATIDEWIENAMRVDHEEFGDLE